MREPGFWQAGHGHLAARLLAPLAALYGAAGARRMDQPGAIGPCPVICLGNFTLGGAGKTPAALAVAAILQDLGAAPVFLSRGYGGRLAGPVQVSATHGSADVGDEPLLLARAAPAVIARDRPAGAALCRSLGATAIVMDDGLQNPSLAKSLAFAVIDAATGVGNGRVFPAGPLRLPLRRQWPHIGGVILIGEGAAGDALAAEAKTRGCPVHRARLVPDAVDLSSGRWLAFAGIGRPEKFFTTLREAGAALVGTRSFPDHHPYREAELMALAEEADRLGVRMITTEKDAVRLPPGFAARVEVLKVVLRFEDEESVRRQLTAVIQRATSETYL
ncbi:tetraacyldisaccharide 4'-kinase [Methylobacterium komagatae]|uniref:Tetraacyldisaccharide 4'-kinase n=1 Tax=Methylobacterium komagatae TaxID=374425 RepID=A0ABW2BPX7_9HYPH